MLEYTNPFALDPDEEGTCYAEWCLNGSFKNFSGIIVRGNGLIHCLICQNMLHFL